MKILHVTNLFPTTSQPDLGIFVKEQIDSLEAEGCECDVFHIRTDLYGISAYFKAIVPLLKLRAHYDVFHSHHVFTAFLAAFVFIGRPKVASFLSSGFDIERHSKLYMFAPLVYFTACILHDALITKVPRSTLFQKKFYYLPNGVDDQVFMMRGRDIARRKIGLPLDAIILLFVSSKSLDRREKRKDIFDQLVENLPDTLYGKPIKPLYLSNEQRGLVPYYFNAADVHVLTSDYEGSPNSVKEALSSGCPVLASNVGDVPNLLLNVPFCLSLPQSEIIGESGVSFVSRVANIGSDSRINIREEFAHKNLGKTAIAKNLRLLYERLF